MRFQSATIVFRFLRRSVKAARGKKWGGKNVRLASQNPYPIYDQNLRFFLLYLWPEKYHSFKKIPSSRLEYKNHTKTAENPILWGPHIPILTTDCLPGDEATHELYT